LVFCEVFFEFCDCLFVVHSSFLVL
jgi:hypothetical protein